MGQPMNEFEDKTPADVDRIKQAIADDFDEELEMQMEDDRLDELVAEAFANRQAELQLETITEEVQKTSVDLSLLA